MAAYPPCVAVGQSQTADLILRAAERLFAAQGFDRVTIREINRVAEQKNESALHYYFQSKEGLLSAIVSKHALPTVEATRALFDAANAADGHCTSAELSSMVIIPLARLLETPDGRDYLRIIGQFAEFFPHRSVRPAGAVVTNEHEVIYSQVLNLIVTNLTFLPVPVRWERIAMLGDMMIYAIVRRAEAIESGRIPALDDDEFVDNLVQMSDAALHAPAP